MPFPADVPSFCRWQMARCDALRRLWPGRAQDTQTRYSRPDVFQLIADRETEVWERWPNENDREKALKFGRDGNMRPSHPFMLAWDRAFKEAFGTEPPRARLGSGVLGTWNIFVQINKNPPSEARPNGWWTTELAEPIDQ